MAGPALATVLAAVLGSCAAQERGGQPPTPPPATVAPGQGQAALHLPSIKGLNYDGPAAANGQWLGTRWLRADGSWDAARPRLQADLGRVGSRPTVASWDLFNEAYNSLGTEGGLHRSPGEDSVSTNYPTRTVHAWIKDLYQAAKRAAPAAWFTVSDATELYWKDRPDTAKYDDAVDFYDIHGEVGGDIDHGFKDQAVNSRVVSFWLSHARELGIQAVHSAEVAVYTLRSRPLTPTGQVIEAAQ